MQGDWEIHPHVIFSMVLCKLSIMIISRFLSGCFFYLFSFFFKNVRENENRFL